MKKIILLIACILLANTIFGQAFDNVPYLKKYTPEQLHQDLDFLLKKFEEIHPDYLVKRQKM